MHPWRQTHTALSAYEMASRNGPFWSYRTPIFGPPWQWPLELPVYQWLVAEVSRFLPLDLERAGRAVSIAFYVATFVPGWIALEAFDMAPRHRPVVLALVWASPLYIFWSRTFMIESTALFFAVAYFALVHRATSPARARVSTRLLLVAAVVGALAGTIKVTAFVAFITAAAALLALRWRRSASPRRIAPAAVAALLVPVLSTGAWLAFADHMKTRSPLANEMDFAAEREQRFGTIADRFALRSWYVVPANAIYGGTRHAVIPSPLVFGLAFAAMLWRRRHLAACLACLGLYLLPIAIFMRPFLAHVYYAYENGLLIAVIAGCGVVTCLEGPRLMRWAGVALFAAALTAMAGNYLRGYYVEQASADLAPMPLAVMVQKATHPDEVLLIYGEMYAPILPYEARRRAIMDAQNRRIDDPSIVTSLAGLRAEGTHVGAVVSCGESRQDAVVRENIRRLGFPGPPLYSEPSCDLYARH